MSGFCRRREPVIIDDDDDYSLSHHHHHHHHQLPAAYLQLAGKVGQDSPPLSPGEGRTLSDAGTLTAGCAYCPAPTAAVGSDGTGDRATSAGDFDGLSTSCVRCGHQHRVHTYGRANSSDYFSGQHLLHCRHQEQLQQQDVI